MATKRRSAIDGFSTAIIEIVAVGLAAIAMYLCLSLAAVMVE